MARPKIPEELKKLHWRQYMSAYRQRQKQQQMNLKAVIKEDNSNDKNYPTSTTYPQD